MSICSFSQESFRCIYIFIIFSRLVRQDNVKEENRIGDQRSPNKRTFGDAKQNLPEYDDMNPMNAYNEGMYNQENTFREADEDDTFDTQEYPSNYYGSTDSKNQQQLQQQQKHDDEEISMHQYVVAPTVHTVDNYMNDSLPEYSSPSDDNLWYTRKERPHRRRSRDLSESEGLSSHDEDTRRKPETMRSISEDTPTRNIKQTITRRTLSHPEKETQSQVKHTTVCK